MRGTFSHRHSVYFDVRSNEPYSPLAKLNPPTEFCVYNSPLSEMGVLGFEYGNSCTDPTFLTIWEAQFGDFSNGAQIIIDQFISSGEAKWFRMNGLVLFLPHGYEGQGPEHSSARMERYLQLCAQGNMQVCHLTTPAQLFHVLRRQVKRAFRKPLVMMTPKSLLRHPLVKSSLEELGQGAFTEVIDDAVVANPAKVERVVFCTGKFYYDLAEHRQKSGDERVALVRLEQVYPFHEKRVGEVFARYGRAKQWVWAQEEPKNMGAYSFVGPRFQQVLTQMKLGSLTYVGRSERASPATGSHHFHEEEQHHIVQECFA
jgi:2-oxoglutarate dehydrogenase E1 component